MEKTQRLFYQDPMLSVFTARVLDCQESQNGYAILLDQTAFYPEGGGEPADQGRLQTGELSGAGVCEARVNDVREVAGEILHYTDIPLPKGCLVQGEIDWERRFDLMQQHSGEHLVSGLIHARLGLDNVGFHMGSDVVTIDFNGPLCSEQLLEIEEEANRLVWQNIETEIIMGSKESLGDLEYRSKKELKGEVRIVRFSGADTCACCGIHVKNTGQIGMIRILSCEKFRGGARVEMICGGRVLTWMRGLDDQAHQVSVLLSAKKDRLAEAVHRLWEENYRLRGQLGALEEEHFSALAAHYAGHGNVLILKRGLQAESVRRLADAVAGTCGGRCAVFSENDDGTWKYAIGEAGGDLRQFVKAMNQQLKGRGGGKPFFVQGSVTASEKEIRGFFELEEDA